MCYFHLNVWLVFSRKTPSPKVRRRANFWKQILFYKLRFSRTLKLVKKVHILRNNTLPPSKICSTQNNLDKEEELQIEKHREHSEKFFSQHPLTCITQRGCLKARLGHKNPLPPPDSESENRGPQTREISDNTSGSDIAALSTRESVGPPGPLFKMEPLNSDKPNSSINTTKPESRGRCDERPKKSRELGNLYEEYTHFYVAPNQSRYAYRFNETHLGAYLQRGSGSARGRDHLQAHRADNWGSNEPYNRGFSRIGFQADQRFSRPDQNYSDPYSHYDGYSARSQQNDRVYNQNANSGGRGGFRGRGRGFQSARGNYY